MKIRLRTLTPLVAALLAGVACSDDDDGGAGPATDFIAVLSGDNEVPPVATDAAGNATLSIEGDQIAYTVNVTDLANPVVAHIHVQVEGQNGPVRLNLCGTGAPEPECASGDGVLATGTNGATLGITFDSLVSAMRTGGAYVNVHTDDGVDPPNTGAGDMAGGEIRGQIEPQ
jgi:hypothetical protein